MRVIECTQMSGDWWKARRGIPTASDFDKILTPKQMKPSASQEGFIHQLIAERYANIWPDQSGYVSPAMAYGVENEERARADYAFVQNVDVIQVGFCLSDCERYGCSPDGLIGDDGGLELKCPNLETHTRYLLEGVLPAEYRCQVHGELLVTGREWWDFVSWSDSLPVFRVRVTPDSFTAALKSELEKFCDKYAKAVERIEGIRNGKAGHDDSGGSQAAARMERTEAITA